MHSYDACNLKTGEVPNESLCRFTVNGLKHIFSPLINIALKDGDKIEVEGDIMDFSALPPNGTDGHIEYIQECMLEIVILYEDKMDIGKYDWYFKD